METDGANHEIERRTSKWKKQQPVMSVVMTLALGLRKRRSELRRRVEAWKELTSLEDYIVDETVDEYVVHTDEPVQEVIATSTQIRTPFHARFKHWANNGGSEIIRKLRWTIPTKPSRNTKDSDIAPIPKQSQQ